MVECTDIFIRYPALALITYRRVNMKKFLSIILTAMLVLALAVPFAAAADEEEAVITLNSIDNAKPGDEIIVTASISGNYKVHCVNFTCDYDVNALELNEAKQGDFLNQIGMNGNLVILDSQAFIESGRIVLGIACPVDAMNGSGDLVVMRFRIKENVTVNTQVILYVSEFGYMPIGDTFATPVKFSSHNSIITLVGGTVPEGGYNEGENGSYQGEPITPVPGLTAIPQEPATLEPDATELPTVTQDASDTAEPDGAKETLDPGSKGDALITNAPSDTPADDKPKGSNTVLICVLAGVVVLGAVAAVVLITKSKKNK